MYRNKDVEYDVELLEQKLGISHKQEGTQKPPLGGSDVLEEEEKVSGQAEKNRIQSRRQRDNLREKKIRRSGAMKEAAKREMKLQAVKKLMEEKEEFRHEEATTGIGRWMYSNIISGAKRAGLKLLVKGLLFIGSFLVSLLLGCLSLLIALLPLLLVVMGVICVLVAVSVVAGIFVGPENVMREDFAVKMIYARQCEMLDIVESFEGSWYQDCRIEEVELEFEDVDDIMSNSDDILLAYMAKAADVDDMMEDGSAAPLLNVDTVREMLVLERVLEDMLYISAVEYVRYGGETDEEAYYKAVVTITGMGAGRWIRANGNQEDREAYSFLYDVFHSFGYSSLGGDTVCREYLGMNRE
ncbi:MAG: hypothetical protein J6J42_04025 [Lachnospiraceae bacterium]|nr:hypothetical protein [Lachnospiraceae bacterium]